MSCIGILYEGCMCMRFKLHCTEAQEYEVARELNPCILSAITLYYSQQFAKTRSCMLGISDSLVFKYLN